MTPPPPTILSPLRWSSLRSLLLMMFLTAAVYAGALPVYFFFRFRAAASGLARGTAAACDPADLFSPVRSLMQTRRAAERGRAPDDLGSRARPDINRSVTWCDSALGGPFWPTRPLSRGDPLRQPMSQPLLPLGGRGCSSAPAVVRGRARRTLSILSPPPPTPSSVVSSIGRSNCSRAASLAMDRGGVARLGPLVGAGAWCRVVRPWSSSGGGSCSR